MADGPLALVLPLLGTHAARPSARDDGPAPLLQPRALEEPELIQGALGGDGDCWSQLIARHNHKVVVSLLARGIPLEQAKDLSQETWLRLVESQRAGRLAVLQLPGLAIVQAGYLAANARRRDGRDPEPRAAVPEPSSTAELPDEQLIHQEELDRVAEVLQTCSAAARRVFQFVYEHPELSYSDIAQRLDLSTQRVKQTVCEVRKRLRAALHERDEEP